MTSLQAWLQSHHVALPVIVKPQKIPGRGGGYGMVAGQAIKKGEKLVNVPRDLWMTSLTARTSEVCGHVVKERGLDSWKALSLHLLCERRLGKRSFWREYIRSLPDQEEHPILWDAEKLSWLKGSPMATKLSSRAEQVIQDAQALVEAGANGLFEPSTSAEPLVSEHTAKWVAATLLSRAFNLEIPSQKLNGAAMSSSNGAIVEVEAELMLALVPWADSLNHCSTATDRSILQYDHANDSAVLFAHKDYAEGEEVFESYGTWLTPSELLLDYGFVDQRSKTNAITVRSISLKQHAPEFKLGRNWYSSLSAYALL